METRRAQTETALERSSRAILIAICGADGTRTRENSEGSADIRDQFANSETREEPPHFANGSPKPADAGDARTARTNEIDDWQSVVTIARAARDLASIPTAGTALQELMRQLIELGEAHAAGDGKRGTGT